MVNQLPIYSPEALDWAALALLKGHERIQSPRKVHLEVFYVLKNFYILLDSRLLRTHSSAVLLKSVTVTRALMWAALLE